MACAQFSHAGLAQLRVVDLREILRSMGLPIAGLKKDLIDRIIQYQSRLQTKALLLDLEISRIELSTKELEVSRFRSANINHASSSLNLAANPTHVLQPMFHDNAPENKPQEKQTPNMVFNNSVHDNVNNVNHNVDAAREQRQLGQGVGLGQASSVIVPDDMLLTLPHASNPIQVHIQANEPQASLQAGLNSIVSSQLKSNDSEWLIRKPAEQKPVTKLGASQQNNGRLLQSHNDNDSATGFHSTDNNAWLCKSNVRSSVNTQSLSGWHISALPPESNSRFKTTQPQSDETIHRIFSCQSNQTNSSNPNDDLELSAQDDISANAQSVVQSSSETTPGSHDSSKMSSCNHSEGIYHELIRAQLRSIEN